MREGKVLLMDDWISAGIIVIVATVQVWTVYSFISVKKTNDERWKAIRKAQAGHTAVIEEIAHKTGVEIQIELHKGE